MELPNQEDFMNITGCAECLNDLKHLFRVCPLSEQFLFVDLSADCESYYRQIRQGENHPELLDKAVAEIHALLEHLRAMGMNVGWFHEPANRAEENRMALVFGSAMII